MSFLEIEELKKNIDVSKCSFFNYKKIYDLYGKIAAKRIFNYCEENCELYCPEKCIVCHIKFEEHRQLFRMKNNMKGNACSCGKEADNETTTCENWPSCENDEKKDDRQSKNDYQFE